jgi:hypothetical protein
MTRTAAGRAAAWPRTRIPAHLRVTAIRLFSVNAAYAVPILNTIVVNADARWRELPETCKKFAVRARFLYFKTTVNYNHRFELTTHFTHS